MVAHNRPQLRVPTKYMIEKAVVNGFAKYSESNKKVARATSKRI